MQTGQHEGQLLPGLEHATHTLLRLHGPRERVREETTKMEGRHNCLFVCEMCGFCCHGG